MKNGDNFIDFFMFCIGIFAFLLWLLSYKYYKECEKYEKEWMTLPFDEQRHCRKSL